MLSEFQKQSLAIIAYVYMTELYRNPKNVISGRHYSVTATKDYSVNYIDLEALSRDSVKLQHNSWNWHAYSDMVDSGRVRVQTEDEEGRYRPFWIERVYETRIEGSDYDSKPFTVTIPNSHYVEIESGEKRSKREFRLDWTGR